MSVRISVVTPSYNQGRYIERTIESVLGQTGDFELEYCVVDGGSTDGTIDILRRYGSRFRWVSEPDGGQSDAINKGFRMTNGEIIAWLNSDDLYHAGALESVALEYRRESFDWCFGNCRIVDEDDREIRRSITAYKVAQAKRYSYRRLLRRCFVSQPAAFFSRAAYEAAGEVSRELTYSMDYDYWLRLGRRSPPRYVDRFLADFRWHTRSKNGAAYRAAAWETYQTARRHAGPGHATDLAFHFLHFCTLSVVYRFL